MCYGTGNTKYICGSPVVGITSFHVTAAVVLLSKFNQSSMCTFADTKLHLVSTSVMNHYSLTIGTWCTIDLAAV